MHRDRTIQAELLFRLQHLSDEIDEILAGFRHTLLRPFGILEMTDRSGLAILKLDILLISLNKKRNRKHTLESVNLNSLRMY